MVFNALFNFLRPYSLLFVIFVLGEIDDEMDYLFEGDTSDDDITPEVSSKEENLILNIKGALGGRRMSHDSVSDDEESSVTKSSKGLKNRRPSTDVPDNSETKPRHHKEASLTESPLDKSPADNPAPKMRHHNAQLSLAELPSEAKSTKTSSHKRQHSHDEDDKKGKQSSLAKSALANPTGSSDREKSLPHDGNLGDVKATAKGRGALTQSADPSSSQPRINRGMSKKVSMKYADLS